MSRIIDFVSIAAALGITGYFFYKVILPGLKDIKLPTFQPPNISFLPGAQQPVQYSTTPAVETPATPDENDDDDKPPSTPQQSAPAAATAPPPITGDVLWDSNRDGKWNNGQARKVTKTEGNQGANGKGIYMAASGNPRLIIDGNGVAHLEHDGEYGRFYVKACNYNARLEGECMFEHGHIDSLTFKLRNRHGMGGACQNRFGGVGGVIELGGSVESKIEKCHNEHEKGVSGSLPKKPQVGQWIGFRYTVVDTPDRKGINQRVEIDFKDGQGFKTYLNSTFSNPPAYYMDEATFNKESEFWVRMNTPKTARSAWRNLRLVKVSPGTASTKNITVLQRYPYLFNSFYNRRRL